MSGRDSSRKRGGRGELGDVAIIGMACLFPGAPDLETYWSNIVTKLDAIADPPSGSWDVDVHFDADSSENDRVYCKKGGYLGDFAEFDPLEHGVLPHAVQGGEPEQWLALKVANEAVADAGYSDGVPRPERTAVILGKGDYINRGNLGLLQHHGFVDQTLDIIRSLNPGLTEDDLQSIRSDLKRKLPPFNADTVQALVPNIAAGRIANRLGLMGPSYTVDAACASSLIAVDIAIQQLRGAHCDMALVGGMHVSLPMVLRQVFCQLGALSHLQRIRPFDESADGTILGEGVGMAVLQRLEDAERDDRRIYAVIKGVGTASDGHGLSVMAPRLEGEILALRRAYELAGISPRTIGLIEAHGTGTPVGDATEIQALSEAFGVRTSRFPRCAVGSVKSMIGHLMPAAGIAALIKTALALHHRVVPPTLGVEHPRADLLRDDTPFYLSSEARPWIHGEPEIPRRAGVNAFGFGGINAHAILEEHGVEDGVGSRPSLTPWDFELILLNAPSRQLLIERIVELRKFLELAPRTRLVDLAYTLNTEPRTGSATLGLVAESVEDLDGKLARAFSRLESGKHRQLKDTRGGVYYFGETLAGPGRLAFLFPGEGSQYAGMLGDLCMHFPEARRSFEISEGNFVKSGSDILPSECFFPPRFAPTEAREFADTWLWQMQGAVTAVLTADHAMFTVLSRLGVRPDAVLGHSTGEFSAMVASGMIDLTDDHRAGEFAAELNQLFQKLQETESRIPRSLLVAVGADAETVDAVIGGIGGGIQVAMDNCPHQSIIAGDPEPVERAVKAFQAKGLICEKLPFDRPYHTRHFSPFAEPMAGFFERWVTRRPEMHTYTCASKTVFPSSIDEMRSIAVEQWMRPVAFRETIEKMYEDGARIFVEVGARGNLSSFVADTLRGMPHLAMPANLENRSGICQLQHLLAALAAHGVEMQLGFLYSRRRPRKLDLGNPAAEEASAGSRSSRIARLETGWPVLELSEETLASLRARVETASPAVPARAPEADVPVIPPVVSAHMQAMEQFLEINEEVMQAYLEKSGRRAPRPNATAKPAGFTGEAEENSDSRLSRAAAPVMTKRAGSLVPAADSALDGLPFVGSLVSHEPGEQLVALRKLDVDEDLFLRHHTFGRRVSTTDPSLLGLAVMPLTVSMELMAEAASILAPGRDLVGMRNVRGFRWIAPESGSIELKTVAKRIARSPREEIQVHVYEAPAESSPASEIEIPLIEGTIVFGDRAPAPLAEPEFAIAGRRSSKWAPERLYEEVMFHEPAMQGVASLDAVGDDGAEATVKVLPRDGLFRSNRAPRFLTDPVLLDQAGQIVGFWAKDYWLHDVFFPFHVEETEFFDSPPPEGEEVRCRARVQLEGQEQVRANLEVVRADGTLWMRCRGWQDRRFLMPNRVIAFFLSPPTVVLSEPWPDTVGGEESVDATKYRLLRESFPDDFFTSGGGIWLRSLALAVLARSERAEWHERLCKRPVPQRVEWLLGRIVAKDAVREHVKRHHGLNLCPADIAIRADAAGRMHADGPWVARVPRQTVLSVETSREQAVAVCRHRLDTEEHA